MFRYTKEALYRNFLEYSVSEAIGKLSASKFKLKTEVKV
jgi:hypothetical protein